MGGAVHSAEDVHPGFVHDTFSSFYPLGAASPAIQQLDLERHGLRWRHAPAVLGHPTPDGQWALLHRDRDLTARGLEERHAGDGEAWLGLCRDWDRIGSPLVDGMLSPFPPARRRPVAARAPRVGGLEFVKTLLTPAADLMRARFGGEAPRLLLAGNAGHADIPLDAPGSGLMGLLMSMLGQTVGFPVPEGGAASSARALARRFTSAGGEIRTDSEVASIDVERGRATGVRTRDGERFAATRAVVADVVAPHLYGGLVSEEDLPRRTVQRMKGFRMGPSTVKVDWALDGPVPWASPPAYAPGTIHVGDSVGEIQESLGQVAAGVIPSRPFLLAGQMTTADPTRSPAGTESMWAYTHVPQQTRRDDGETVRGVWDDADCQRFADRMQDRIEALAPGFVTDPRPPRARAPRARGAQRQPARRCARRRHRQPGPAAVLRPVPGLGRAETPIAGLFLGSSSAHPGGGVHGAPGRNAARAALAHARLPHPRRTPRLQEKR